MSSIRVAIVNDYELVVRGIGEMLAGHDRIDVVELAADTMPKGEHVIDIALYDTFGSLDQGFEMVAKMIRNPQLERVVVFTLDFDDARIAKAIELGACGYLSKTASGDDLANALCRVHDGEIVVSEQRVARVEDPQLQWPGRGFGLTEREANVLSLIAQGLDNNEIADRLYISPNTLKTRIRSLYRKIEASSRVQAALWAVKHGFEPDRAVRWTTD